MKIAKNYSARILMCGAALLALPAAFADHADEMFKKMDTNHDNRISREEHASATQQEFAKLDANNDVSLSAAELEAVDKDGKSSGNEMVLFDRNADGKVTQAEFEARAEIMFIKMDTDNDLFISKEECEAGHKKIKK